MDKYILSIYSIRLWDRHCGIGHVGGRILRWPSRSLLPATHTSCNPFCWLRAEYVEMMVYWSRDFVGAMVLLISWLWVNQIKLTRPTGKEYIKREKWKGSDRRNNVSIVIGIAQGIPKLGKEDNRRAYGEENTWILTGFPRCFGNISGRFSLGLFWEWFWR